MRPIATFIFIIATLTGAATSATVARANVKARSAQNAPVSNARAAVATNAGAKATTTGRTTVQRGAAPQNTNAQTKNVAARAATTQKVINSGTTVAAAKKNTAIDTSCQEKYNGCMDTFCMMDGISGGRCLCSNKINDLDKQLQQIEQQDAQSYKIATIGVEAIENNIGVNTIASATTTGAEINIPDRTNDLRGDALGRQSHDICIARIPECASEIQMLQILYNGQIRSDCAAYENSIKQQQQSSAQKLATAEQALRSAALKQFRDANKYDLGQCTVEFKKCMQATAGCGDDFSGCATVAANDQTNTRKSTRATKAPYSIQGTATTIEISASTYDALASKKPLCDSVTNQCQSVADNVWPTFLRDAAPQLKSAELIAEDNVRQNCVANISNCFQKACKDTMDPNDPDGSYDMCLTRPETMLNVCRVPLNACGVDASSPQNAEKSKIWEYVVARLAAMRVDACTTELKQCLQSTDRCGADYTQCVGLDTDTIIRMCSYDKLVGCQKVYGTEKVRGDDVYDALSSMVQGIMLNIDNEMLAYCQNAANEAMIRVCGDTESCNAITTDENIGARSLEYKICPFNETDILYDDCRTDVSKITDRELGRIPGATSNELGPVTPFVGLTNGIIYWHAVDVDDTGRITSPDDYFKSENVYIAEQDVSPISTELGMLQSNTDAIISTIESDPIVQYCMTGRTIPGMDNTKLGRGNAARFPKLTNQMRKIIATHTLKTARENYNKKYDRLIMQMQNDYITIAQRQAEIKGENGKDARREPARQSCIALADLSSAPVSPPPPNGWGQWVVLGVIGVATVVASVLTFGAAGAAAGALAAAKFSTELMLTAKLAVDTVALTTLANAATTAMTVAITTTVLMSAATVGAATYAGVATAAKNNGNEYSIPTELTGRHEMEQWNYRQTITTEFNWTTLNCHKCVETTNCAQPKNPAFGKKYCKQWADSETTCTDIQF